MTVMVRDSNGVGVFIKMVGKLVGNRRVIRQKRRITSVCLNKSDFEFNGLGGFSTGEARLLVTFYRIFITQAFLPSKFKLCIFNRYSLTIRK